jgi:hypothetical protein
LHGHVGRRAPASNVLAGALVPALVLCAVTTARAESARLEEAARMVEEADFEHALEALESAAAADDLTRADVIRLLSLRSLVNHALRNEREIDADLLRLASVEPGFAFEDTVPPALQTRLARARERLTAPLGLAVEATEIRGGFRIDARVEGDVGTVIRSVAISARLPGGDWVRTEGATASIPVRGGGAVEYYAQAFGPGGAVLLEEGSEDDPRSVGTPGAGEPDVARGDGATTPTGPIGEGPGARPPRRRAWPWVLFGTGVAALIAGVVVAAVLIPQDQGTQLGAPEVDWP